jgi:hypothetical protein
MNLKSFHDYCSGTIAKQEVASHVIMNLKKYIYQSNDIGTIL